MMGILSRIRRGVATNARAKAPHAEIAEGSYKAVENKDKALTGGDARSGETRKAVTSEELEELYLKKSGARVADSVLDLIFNTPMVRLGRMVGDGMATVYAKLESYTPGGSVKDRIALSMIEDAEERGLIGPGSVIVEPTSGNTGIGLAIVCAVKGYECILVMPESMSLERIYILKSLGARVVLTPSEEGIDGSVKRAHEILGKTEKAYMPQQFGNYANPEVHYLTTAREIMDCVDGGIDAFVSGVGTGGTITGVGRALRERYPHVRIVAVEPEGSAVLSGRPPGMHKIQGIGPGFVPRILDREIITEVVTVGDEEAYEMTLKLARQEGIFCGISSGAACFASMKVARSLGEGKKVVVVFPDTGERYFSMYQYFQA